MADDQTASTAHRRRKRLLWPVDPNRQGVSRRVTDLLYFPLEAKALRTPFRANILQTIYDIAYKELDGKIESADVFVDSDLNQEPKEVHLSLTIWADLDQDEWRRADEAISKAVFEQEESWTEEERFDFRNNIDFAVLPSKA